jgi:hypothetical protein
VSSQDKGPWPQSRVSALDRALGELTRILEKKVTKHCKSNIGYIECEHFWQYILGIVLVVSLIAKMFLYNEFDISFVCMLQYAGCGIQTP